MFDKSESGKFELTAELAALERQLAGLMPLPPRVDRDRLMFAAGRAAGRAVSTEQRARGRIAWLWPAATATMTAASLLLAAMLVWQKELHSDARYAVKPKAAIEAPVTTEVAEVNHLANEVDARLWTARATSGYLGLRHLALTKGVGALEPETLTANGHATSADAPPRPEPATARDLLDELLSNDQSHTRS
jgi:hypothetical protein